MQQFLLALVREWKLTRMSADSRDSIGYLLLFFDCQWTNPSNAASVIESIS